MCLTILKTIKVIAKTGIPLLADYCGVEMRIIVMHWITLNEIQIAPKSGISVRYKGY